MADISQITLPDGTTYDIKDPVARAAAGDAGAGKIFYGVCSTAAATQTKVVTIDDFELFTGALIAVKFENVNTATAPKLNISGTGAINMYSVGTTAVLPNAWVAGETLLFVYNGTSYMVADGGIASTSGYGVTKLNSAIDSTSTTEAATPSAVKSAYDLANEKLDKSGGTMTGALVLASDPTADLQAATKKYVDDNSGINPNLYYWERSTYRYYPSTSTTLTNYTSSTNCVLGQYHPSSTYKAVATYEVSDSISMDQVTGIMSLVNPTTVTLGGTTNDDISLLTTGKYIKLLSYTGNQISSDIINNYTSYIFQLSNNVVRFQTGGVAYMVTLDSTSQLIGYLIQSNDYIINDDKSVVSSNISNTYPQNSDFLIDPSYYPYVYKYLGAGSDLLPKSYVVGNYTGTTSTVTLTFDAPVKAMIVAGDFFSYTSGTSYGIHIAILFGGIYIGDRWSSTSNGSLVSVKGVYTVSDNSVTLPVQFNRNGILYTYVAFF